MMAVALPVVVMALVATAPLMMLVEAAAAARRASGWTGEADIGGRSVSASADSREDSGQRMEPLPGRPQRYGDGLAKLCPAASTTPHPKGRSGGWGAEMQRCRGAEVQSAEVRDQDRSTAERWTAARNAGALERG